MHTTLNKTITIVSKAVRRVASTNTDTAALRAALQKAAPGAVEENPTGESAITIKRYKDRIRNPMTAIRAKCVECSNGSIAEVQQCRVTTCALYLFRAGKNPFHSKSKAYAELHAHDADEADTEEGSE